MDQMKALIRETLLDIKQEEQLAIKQEEIKSAKRYMKFIVWGRIMIVPLLASAAYFENLVFQVGLQSDIVAHMFPIMFAFSALFVEMVVRVNVIDCKRIVKLP